MTGMNPRDRILQAAARLLAEGGREAVSTRAVSSAAGVQAPTIYRQFGDMQGLLDVVASHGYATYLASHRARETDQDPVEDLRRGWNLHVDFGLANPALYMLMYGNPRPDTPHPAAAELQDVLLDLVRRVAEAGRLRVGIEHAADMLSAAGAGVVFVLIAQGGASRDRTLSVATREAILAAITTDQNTASAHARPSPRSDATHHAVALKASLSRDARPFTAAECALFAEWLTRFIETEP
ncbi:MAG: TetR/AcrR family transcriptional regulator [Herpetosiphonaceae bacterium]|nr:TetR/AcrR family transcriptional regulator [Herpetosiphonaceae bacterium]